MNIEQQLECCEPARIRTTMHHVACDLPLPMLAPQGVGQGGGQTETIKLCHEVKGTTEHIGQENY